MEGWKHGMMGFGGWISPKLPAFHLEGGRHDGFVKSRHNEISWLPQGVRRHRGFLRCRQT
jgi:hypothetical protein